MYYIQQIWIRVNKYTPRLNTCMSNLCFIVALINIIELNIVTSFSTNTKGKIFIKIMLFLNVY